MFRCLRKILSGFHPKPVMGWEILIMRIFFAIVVYKSMPTPGQIFDNQPVPNGIAHLIDLTFLARPGVYPAMKVVLVVALTVYATGFLLPLALPLMLAIHVMARTLYNSQGWIHHGFQMVSLVILAQTIVVLTFAIYRLVKKRPYPFTEGRSLGSYFLFYSQMAVVSIYVVSVVSKIDRSDGHWFAKSHYVGLHVVKAERDRYYAKLQDPAPGTEPAPKAIQTARTALAHPNLTRIVLGAGVLLELLAFVALYSRGAALLIALGMIGFHRSIASLMSIYFHFNEWLLLIFLINVPFWLWWATRRLATGKADREPVASTSAT